MNEGIAQSAPFEHDHFTLRPVVEDGSVCAGRALRQPARPAPVQLPEEPDP